MSGGPKEIMEQCGIGKYGVLCERENVEALASSILLALDKEYKKANFKQKATEFEIDYSAEKYLEFAKE